MPACQVCKTHETSPTLMIDDNTYCSDYCAADEGWVECGVCSSYGQDDEVKQEYGDSYCPSCWGAAFDVCDHCNETTRKTNLTTQNGNDYCIDCYDTHFGDCYGCGWTYDQDDLTHCNDEWYCNECIPDETSEASDQSGDSTFMQVPEHRFGIELEYNEADMTRGYPHFGRGTDHCGIEYRSGIMYGDAGLQHVRDFAEYADRNFDNGDDCGYHLHLDCRILSVDELKSIAYAYELTHPLWTECVDPARASCGYCDFDCYDSSRIRDIKATVDFRNWARRQARYVFINWSAFSYHGTVEVRGHQGTSDPDEICNWIQAHTRFIDCVKRLSWDEVRGRFGEGGRDNWEGIIGSELATFYKAQAGLWQPVSC